MVIGSTCNRKKGKNMMTFECNMEKSKNLTGTDIWGAAFLWAGETKGAEYNLCIDENGENCSAIYKMYADAEGDIQTDHSTFVNYEVDFEEENWKENLRMAMEDALKYFSQISIQERVTKIAKENGWMYL